jgi:hypothetical protein
MRSRAGIHLRQLAVANRCTEDWNGMRGDGAVRFCGTCRQHVYNLSAMSEADAEQLLSHKEDACVRYAYRADGTIVTSACVTSTSAGARRAPATLAAGVAGALAYSGAFVGISTAVEQVDPSAARDDQTVQVAMGGLKLNLDPKKRPRRRVVTAPPPAIEPTVSDAPSDLTPSRPDPIPPAVVKPLPSVLAAPAEESGWSAWWAALGALLVLVFTIGMMRRTNPAERSGPPS